jgi:hypothetical protein
MAVFCPLSTQPVYYLQELQVGALITLYNAGTLTPRSAYADGLLSTPYAQPILSDANGCIPEIWIGGTTNYKMRIVAPTGVQLREVDNLPGDVAGASPPPPPPPGTVTLQTGDVVWAYTTTIIPGRVRANGKTVGNPLSGASEFADPGAQNLFEFLWNADPNLLVIGGRGLSAVNDWNANKAITLPDVNGRVIAGIDGMGALPIGRFGSITFSRGNANQLGSTGGSAQITQTTAQVGVHVHTATTQSAGSHQHTGTTDVNAVQNYNAVTDVQGYHSHGGATGGFSVQIYARGSTDAAGTHSHGGLTGLENQNHNHAGAAYPASTSTGAGPGAASSYWWGGGGGNTGLENQTHNHNINADGNHAHTATLPVDNHTHAIAGDGTHQHNVTVTLVAHQHTITTDPNGIHVHTLSTDAMPATTPMDVTQPFILMTAYMVL